MFGEVDALDFLVAEALGKTLAEVRALPQAELTEWKAFYTWRAAMADFAQQEPSRG